MNIKGVNGWRYSDKAGDDGAKGGKSGDDDKDKDKNTGVDPKQFNLLVETVNKLTESVGSTNVTVKQLSEAMAAQQTKKGDDDDSDDDDIEVSELESMSRLDFAKYLGKIYGKELDNRMKTVTDQIAEVRGDLGNKAASDNFKEMSAKYKDFKDWVPEMKDIAETNKGISLENAYLLARTKNVEKAKEMDEKYNPPEEDNKAKGFGGLTPTSGKTATSTEMSKEEASEAAWQESGMADISTELLGEGNS